MEQTHPKLIRIDGWPPVYRYGTISSTNTEAMRLGEDEAPHGTVVLADYQTAGRGKLHAKWHMPAGEGILLSILYREMPSGIAFGQLTLQIGREVAELLRKATQLKIEVKKPNDLLVGGKKIAGILCEARWRGENLLYAVVGIGINVNVMNFPDEIAETAGSLALAAGHRFELEPLTAQLIDRLRAGRQGADGVTRSP